MASLFSPDQPRGVGEWLVILFSILLILLGLALGAGGIWLIALGGSWYYLVAGLALIASGALMLAGRLAGVWLYVTTWALTWVWAIWEVGGNGWALVPRVVAPTVLLILALLCIPVLRRRLPAAEARERRRYGTEGAVAATVVLALAIGAGIVFMRSGIAQEAAPQQQAPAAAPAQPADTSTAAQPAAPAPQQAAAAPADGDWPSYGRTSAALRYSPLEQINAGNVGKLERIWTFNTGDLPDDKTDGKYSPETTPIKVGDNLYLCSAKNQIIALDAATGRERWRYDPKVPDDAVPYGATCRGVAYYANPQAQPDQPCAERIVEGTLDARLIAVDAGTGQLCADFGVAGMVDMSRGIGRTVPGWYGNVAAPVIVRNVVVMGAQVQDGQAEDAPSGVIRGYDVLTGKLAWAWDMCKPELTGEPPQGQTYTRGTPNMWTSAAGDDQLGYVYVPLGNSAVDYFGGNRQDCENRFNSSLVAIDVTTGKPAWHFQTVHYDIWDYDLGSQPTLVDFPTDQGKVPAVILPSKQGEIYVLDRRSGKPLFPVEERKAPKGGVEPDRLSDTQPYSGYHTLARSQLTETDMWGMSPLDQLWCRIQFHRAYYEGEYTPDTHDVPFIQYPGYNGGSDWGSVAVDPQAGVLVANYNDMPNFNRLLTREEAKQAGLTPITDPRGKHDDVQAGSPYAIKVNAGWRLPFTGLMCKQPPYGGIRAIDLKTGKTLWDEPLGEARANGPFGIPSMLPVTIGTPNNGGSVVTAGGLIFIAATTDNLIRAIDIKTGKVLWKDKLPAGGQANPMTFEADGRQYVVLMAGGHHFMETGVGDAVIAWALPDED